jgi:hypothetical protein
MEILGMGTRQAWVVRSNKGLGRETAEKKREKHIIYWSEAGCHLSCRFGCRFSGKEEEKQARRK